MMKKIFICAAIVLISYSCEDVLKEVPMDFISPVNYYSTADDAEGAIISIYVARKDYWCVTIVNQMEECNTDYGIARGSYTSIDNIDLPFDATHQGRWGNVFTAYYRVISRANIAIERIPQINMNEDLKNKLLAEAYFLRADAYLYLVRLWGPVPLRLKETTNLDELAVPRSPKSEVYAQIISDLQFAEEYLPNEVGSATGRVTKWAAKIRLADTYMDIEEWSNAAAKADEVITDSPYELVTVSQQEDFYDIFGTTAYFSEDVWSWHNSEKTQTWLSTVRWLHRPNTYPYCPGTGWWCLYGNVNSPLLLNWDPNDLRYQFNIYTGYYNASGVWVTNPSTTPLMFKKYILDPNGNATYKVPIIRYAEAFLIYAEAACMASGGPTALALERLNIIKRRGYGLDLNTASAEDYPGGMNQQDFRDAVILERAYEFFLERKRVWDLIRTNTIKEVMQPAYGKTYANERILWPIPQSEIDNNKALTPEDQNPGY